MIVMKFGGTSVRNGPMIRQVSEIIRSQMNRNPVVIVSAHAGVTDHLIQLGESAHKGQYDLNWLHHLHTQILQELDLSPHWIAPLFSELTHDLNTLSSSPQYTTQQQDKILSFGERLSAIIIAQFLQKIGIPARAHEAPDLGLLTDENFGEAQPLASSYTQLCQNITALREVPVITGFLGKTLQGHWTTLGRSGSDFSASIIGNAISAEEIQFWKDVPGVMTADPRVVTQAHTVPVLSFEEASEMACYGAKILHPSSVLPAIEKNIPIRILNTNAPDFSGTTIGEGPSARGGIKAIIHKKNIVVLRLKFPASGLFKSEFLQKVFGVFARYQIRLGLIVTVEDTLTLTLHQTPNSLHALTAELESLGTSVQIEQNKSLICLIGRAVPKVREFVAKIFKSLHPQETEVVVISQGLRKINIAFLVDQTRCFSTIQILHQAFFESSERL